MWPFKVIEPSTILFNMAIWTSFSKLRLLLLIVLLVQLSNASRPSLFSTSSFSADEPGNDSTIWAVLVAGSSGYYNYRHQANVCHAYQILKRGGLKDENIVVFMYDDIANNPSNPRPGTIINSPNASDVYAGVPKDYTGKTVTAANFFAVLLGNATAVKGGSGKVVASKPEDKIFVYFTDHGGPGILGMPILPYIQANTFIDVLKTKHAMGTYSEMVLYIEACDSGSIIQGLLPSDLNIYAITSTNPKELGWATYCPDMNPPPPPGFDTCLGDLFSVSWMEDSDSANLKIETLEQQYSKVKVRTLNSNNTAQGSHVMQYGTVSISNETVSVYQGSAPGNFSADTIQSFDSMGVVNERDADIYGMRQKYNRLEDGSQEKQELYENINKISAHRSHLDSSVAKIEGYLLGNKQGSGTLTCMWIRHCAKGSVRSEGSALVDDWGCLKSMIRTYETYCGSLTQYGMKHTRTFADLCNNGISEKAMEEASKKACSSYQMGQLNPAIVGYSA